MQLVIGRVVKAHGVRGELVVDIRTDEPDERFAPGTKILGAKPTPKGSVDNPKKLFTVDAARHHTGRLLLSLAEITDRNAADDMRGMLFYVETDFLPPSNDPDAFYDHELEGLTAYLVNGTELGVITEVIHAPAGELLSIKAHEDGREILVPFLTAMVPVVDLAASRVVIDAPDGLLDQD